MVRIKLTTVYACIDGVIKDFSVPAVTSPHRFLRVDMVRPDIQGSNDGKSWASLSLLPKAEKKLKAKRKAK